MEPNGADSTPPWKAEPEQSQTQAAPPPPPPPQWTPARYPGAAMQHRLIPPPQHYVPRPPPFYLPHHHFKRHQEGSSGENRTLWVGDLHQWMDEAYLYSCFAPAGEVLGVKVIRNKQTNSSEGYGFVEFYNHVMAEKVLENYSGTLMPNTDQPLRLNWATFGTGEKRSDNVLGHSIFVGDLAADVTDSLLHETFADKYPSIKAAKVVFDVNTGRSKGYGFVRFGDDSERMKAMTEMNGAYCSTRPMRIGAATPRKSSGYQNQYSPQANGSPAHGQSDVNSTNTTVFVGGLDSKITEEDLKQPFSQYGEIVSVKIPLGKGCGFVQFASRNNAEEALQKLNGTVIGSHTVRLSWGRNPANKQYLRDFGNRWTGAYYGGHPYGYGYAALPPPYHDPRMYGAGYGAYPMYGSHHQQQVS